MVVVSGDYPTNCTSNRSGNATDSSSSSGGSGIGSSRVACEGLPVLQLDVSGENGDNNATYASGNGTVDLVFEYEASGIDHQKSP